MSVKFHDNRPRCHGNEMWYKSAITQLVQETSPRFLNVSGGLGSGYWIMSDKFYHDWPPLLWQQNFTQIGYDSSCIGDICKILPSIWVFWGSVIVWYQYWYHSNRLEKTVIIKQQIFMLQRCRFNTGVTMTPIKRSKRQKFVYRIFSHAKNFLSSLHRVKRWWHSNLEILMWKYETRNFAVFCM